MKSNAPEAMTLCHRNEKPTDNAFSLQVLAIAPGDI